MTCPVHVLGPVVQACGRGQRLFPGISAADALAVLRVLLDELGTANPGSYRTHDLRRGHALDLQMSGGSLLTTSVPPFSVQTAVRVCQEPRCMSYRQQGSGGHQRSLNTWTYIASKAT